MDTLCFKMLVHDKTTQYLKPNMYKLNTVKANQMVKKLQYSYLQSVPNHNQNNYRTGQMCNK